MGSPFYPSLFSPSEEEEEDTCRWEETKRLLQANPNIITLDLFLSVLKQQPPTCVVEFLLSSPSSPLVSSDYHLPLIPKDGPTPLQVAVIEGCNVDIVKLLIQACPWALCVTTNQAGVPTKEDPLSLAKRLGKQDLVALLQRPLMHWLEEETSSSHHRRCQQRCSSVDHHQEQQEDLNNIKLLCARLLKRNQQLSKDVKHLQTAIKVIQSKKCDDNLGEETKEGTATTTSTDQKTVLSNRMNEWEIRLEEEAGWNDAVRNDLVGWKQEVEEQLVALQQSRHSSSLGEISHNNENDPPTLKYSDRECKQDSQHYLSDRPKRRCRPFNSIL